jgi:hypothetical protein
MMQRMLKILDTERYDKYIISFLLCNMKYRKILRLPYSVSQTKSFN